MRAAYATCPSCHIDLCDKCIEHTWTGNGFSDLCPQCRGPIETSRRGGPRIAVEPGAHGFLAQLGDIATYPFHPSVLLTLLGLSVLIWAIGWIGHIGAMFAFAATASMYFHIINRTSRGEEYLDPPDFRNFSEDLLRPVMWYIVSYVPLLAALALASYVLYDAVEFGAIASGELGPSALLEAGITPFALALLGFLLLPLVTAIAAMDRSVLAMLSPLRWVYLGRLIGSTFVVAAGAYYTVSLVELVVFQMWMAPGLASLPIPFLIPILIHLIGAIFMAWQARIIGGMCRPYFDVW